MPFFRVFLPGCRKGHTRHTAGRWARDARDTGKSAGNAGDRRDARISCVSRVCRACRVQARKAGRAGSVWLAVLFVFSDCPFCEHILRKKNAHSRLQGRFTPPRATHWLLPKNDNMLLNFLSY